MSCPQNDNAALQQFLFKIMDNKDIRSMLVGEKRMCSVLSLIAYLCHYKKGSSSARVLFRNIILQSRKPNQLKMYAFVQQVQYLYLNKLKGGHKTPCIETQDIVALFTIIRDKLHSAYRLEVEDILGRYLDGDHTLHAEVDANHQMGPVAARAHFVEKVLERAATIPQEPPREGYVYAAVSPAFPGLIKLGESINVPARICSLNTACKHMPYKVVAQAPSRDPVRDERMVKAYFADRCVAGEIFAVSVEEIVSFYALHITNPYLAGQ